MLSKRWIVCLLFSFLISGMFAQENPDAIRNMAIEYYNNKKYSKAIPLFLKYQAFDPKDMEVKYLIGISYLNDLRPERAQAYLSYVIDDKKAVDEAYMYLGQAYQQNNQFEKAIRMYKQYLGKMKMKDPFRESIKDDIKRCVVGRKSVYLDPNADVENVESVNTVDDEFAPVLSRQGDLYFSAIRKGNFGGLLNENDRRDTLRGYARSDIFFTKKKNGEWIAPVPFGEQKYNSRKHDVLTSISKDSRTLYVFKGSKLDEGGDLYRVGVNKVEEVAEFVKLIAPISSPYWDGNAHFYNDSIVVFSSKRQGGYGGKDLYVSILNSVKGAWSQPENLGPQINTPYDEDSPFLSKDGRTLYFSSNNLKSMGGYDIFTTYFIDSSRTWMSPANLGIPINSPGDDLHFKLAENGLKAYFSSARPDGMGGHDLYVGAFRRYLTEQLQFSSPLVFSQVLPPEPVLVQAPEKEVEVEQTVETELPKGQIVQQPKQEPIKKPVLVKTPTPPTPEEIQTYQFSAINYKTEQSDLQPSEMVTLRKLAGLMKTYPQLELTATCHTDDSGPLINNLYYASKRAKVITDYLINEGINPENITVKACGANYPRAKNKNGDGSRNPLGQVLNRRIDVKLTNTAGTPVRVEESEPMISPILADKKYGQFKSMISGLSYKVQIITTRTPFEADVMLEYPDTMLEQDLPSSSFKVTVGLHKRFEDATRLRNEIAGKGFSEAFVVPYLDGVRMSAAQADLYKDSFPDLHNYLSSRK